MDRNDPFSAIHDVAIIGGGHAGLAAAEALARRGQRVLLIERRAALAWECGWALAQDLGEGGDTGWRAWTGRLAAGGGLPGGLPDGAQCEIQAHALVRELGIGLLFYASPVAVERDHDLIGAVVLGTKSGLRRVRARRFIDASDSGELLAVATSGWTAPVPTRQRFALAWRRNAWADRERSGGVDGIADATWSWQRSGWDDERILAIDLPGSETAPRRACLGAISALRTASGAALDEAVISHAGVTAYPTFADAACPAGLPANLVAAIPGRCGTAANTLAARWALGAAAAAAVTGRPAADAPATAAVPLWPEAARRSTEVLVAGLGTGGAIAAIAAARGGAQVVGAEPLPFAGGIGSGGGIHMYYFGVRGGLQEEVDQRVRAVLPSFGDPAQIRCFHPDAKKIVLEAMLAEAGVAILREATVVAARREGRRIAEVLLATPTGPLRLSAAGWIDGTGDGDLGAAAGCGFRYGRAGDGRLHAYTQSVAKTVMGGARPQVEVVNYDSGFVDASDVADLTRARHVGVLQHVRGRLDLAHRPTQVCPAIGLRQDRQLHTDAVLTLDDLIRRRAFPDAIALHGAHYDNHATDYEMESDQALFWAWGCGGWSTRLAGTIPYGALVAKDLDDCWIASRCLGVSEEAHHSVRMQRDIQRIGEVAGLAAAQAKGRGTRAVDVAALRRALAASGALPADAGLEENDLRTGITVATASECRTLSHADPAAALQTGDQIGLWILAQDRTPAGTAAVGSALASDDQAVSFRAAAVLAWWRDPAAAPRLLLAVIRREEGMPEKHRDDQVPRWLAAVGLLRLVPVAAMVDPLADLIDQPATAFHVRVAVAVALEALAARNGGDAWLQGRLPAVLDRMLGFPALGACGDPRRHPLHTAPQAGNWFAVAEDDTWQLHLVAVRTRRHLGLPAHAQALVFHEDPRAMVRRAFALAGAPAALRSATGR